MIILKTIKLIMNILKRHENNHAKSNCIDICRVSKNGQETIIFFIFFDKPDNQNLLEIEKEALGEYEDAYNNINQHKSFTSINLTLVV